MLSSLFRLDQYLTKLCSTPMLILCSMNWNPRLMLKNQQLQLLLALAKQKCQVPNRPSPLNVWITQAIQTSRRPSSMALVSQATRSTDLNSLLTGCWTVTSAAVMAMATKVTALRLQRVKVTPMVIILWWTARLRSPRKTLTLVRHRNSNPKRLRKTKTYPPYLHRTCPLVLAVCQVQTCHPRSRKTRFLRRRLRSPWCRMKLTILPVQMIPTSRRMRSSHECQHKQQSGNGKWLLLRMWPMNFLQKVSS